MVCIPAGTIPAGSMVPVPPPGHYYYSTTTGGGTSSSSSSSSVPRGTGTGTYLGTIPGVPAGIIMFADVHQIILYVRIRHTHKTQMLLTCATVQKIPSHHF
jgi:hypothetical protein